MTKTNWALRLNEFANKWHGGVWVVTIRKRFNARGNYTGWIIEVSGEGPMHGNSKRFESGDFSKCLFEAIYWLEELP